MISPVIESKVLALLARDKGFCASVSPYLSEDLFTLPQHRLFFKFVNDFFTTYGVLPSCESLVHSVKQKVDTINREEIRALGEFVYKVYNDGLSDDVEYIKDEVNGFVKAAAMRSFLSEAGILLEEGEIETITKKFESARLAGSSVAAPIKEFTSTFDARVKEREFFETQRKIPTGFPLLDQGLRGGLAEKELGIVMAPTNVGKSFMLSNLGINGIKQKKRVLYISLELSELELFSRVEANLTGISIDALNTCSDKLKKMKEDYFEKYANLFYVQEFPTGSITVETISAIVHKFNVTIGKLDLLIVDYADLLRISKRGDLRHELRDIYTKLRALGTEANVAIWTATQANRAGYGVENVTEEHVSECLDKMMIADVVLTLNQTDDEYARNEMRAFLAKNRRNRKWSSIKMLTLFDRGQLRELDVGGGENLEGLDPKEIDKWVRNKSIAGKQGEQGDQGGQAIAPTPTESITHNPLKAIESTKELLKDIRTMPEGAN